MELGDQVLIYTGPADADDLMVILQDGGVECERIASLDALLDRVKMIGTAVIAEHALSAAEQAKVRACVDTQPPWSSFPFVLLAAEDTGSCMPDPLAVFGTVTVVPRPLDPRSLVTNVRAALKARQRQFWVRELLDNRTQTRERLEHSERRQRLLIRELHHRVKNTLATVQALMGSTARSALSVEEFRQALLGRISALSHVHEILTEDKWQEAPLRALFLSELSSFGDSIRLEGPDVMIPSHLAVPLAMAAHELAANALRYGALSAPGGRVNVSWSIEPTPERDILRIQWREEKGPPLPVPTRRGFGTQLLERVLRQQAAADIEIDYNPAGLRVTMSVPLPQRTHFHLFEET